MKKTILYIGRDPEITRVMSRLLNARAEWEGIAVCTDLEATELCKNRKVDLVLLGNGIDADSEMDLRKKLLLSNANVKIVQHYGGGSGLLYSEIAEALSIA